MGKICGMAWEIETDIWGRFPMSIVVSSVWLLIFLYFLRIFFNCVFYAFYKENQGLEVPRETRLEKLMRLLEVLKKMHGGKAELSTTTILGVHFWSKPQMEKIKVVAQGGGSGMSWGSYLGGHYYDIQSRELMGFVCFMLGGILIEWDSQVMSL